jgi:hypothetical protein
LTKVAVKDHGLSTVVRYLITNYQTSKIIFYVHNMLHTYCMYVLRLLLLFVLAGCHNQVVSALVDIDNDRVTSCVNFIVCLYVYDTFEYTKSNHD